MNSKRKAPAVTDLAVVSPRRELGAYEALWMQPGATFKSLAEKFATKPDALPSDFVSAAEAEASSSKVFAMLKAAGVHRFGVRINRTGDYPTKLRDARNPVELLYYSGEWELVETRCVAVVGSRGASAEGIAAADEIAQELVKRGFTVVSGLAKGIDTAAHQSALRSGGRTIAVVGTPLGTHYPKENRALQDEIALKHLVISQVPILRYSVQAPQQNRLFFPERNITMSALTEATVIVEAGESTGTLTQARAAQHQGRKLFFLDTCFRRPAVTWPSRFVSDGAVRVRTLDDIWSSLG